MKTTILLAMILMIFVSRLHAQISHGRVQIGGSVGFSHQEIPDESYKITFIGISPSIGVFYKTNHLAGAFINFGYSENANGSNTIDRSYGGGIFFRQYKPTVKNLYLFFDERGFYNYRYSSQGAGHFKYSGVGLSVQPGLAYDITTKVQAEMFLNNFLTAGYSNGAGSIPIIYPQVWKAIH